MKRKKNDIKRTIKKKISLEHNEMGFPQPKKISTVDERRKARIEGKKDKIKLSETPTIKVKSGLSVALANERHNIIGGGGGKPRFEIDPSMHLKKEVPPPEKRKPISIILTAYRSENFIKEALDSIEKQTYFENYNEYEILVGVDGCENTLKKLIKIRNKYRNLRIFMMNKNVGTFIVSNTLINLMNTNNFLRFDSDDIMLPEMINEIMHYSNNYDVIKFSYYNFNVDGYLKLKDQGNIYAAGVIFYKRTVFDIYGGYQPWICTAEGEILLRIGNDLKIKKIDVGLFKRRVHKNSLTQKKETGMYSELRKKYHEKIKYNIEKKIKKINRVVGEYYEV